MSYAYLILADLTPNLRMNLFGVIGLMLYVMGIACTMPIFLRYRQGERKKLMTEDGTVDANAAKEINRAAKTPWPKHARILLFIALMPCIAGCIVLVMLIASIRTAQSHGMYQSVSQFTAKELAYAIDHSPIMDEAPEDLKGSLIIYFRFGCGDCELTYYDLTKRLSGENDVYWISSRSDDGKALLENYAATAVPSGLLVTNDSYVIEPLYTATDQGETVVDVPRLENLLLIKHNMQGTSTDPVSAGD